MKESLPIWKVGAVLLGFPVVHYFYSLALLHRELFTFGGLDFFLTFWLGSVVIYLGKIIIVLRLIAGSGWTPADIGYELSRKGTGVLAASYFAGGSFSRCFWKWRWGRSSSIRTAWPRCAGSIPIPRSSGSPSS